MITGIVFITVVLIPFTSQELAQVTGSVLLAGWLLLQLAQADDTRQVGFFFVR